MYIFIVIALMLAFPLASVVAQLVLTDHSALSTAVVLPIISKWYVFWAVGMRLTLAGLRQIFQPRYTAETILGLKSADSLFLVRELGFANTAMGLTGLGTFFAHAWVAPMAMVGAIFYGLAGINHCFHQNRSSLQNVALVSDLFAALVLATCLFA
jgi:uncharacterized protein DUF6790